MVTYNISTYKNKIFYCNRKFHKHPIQANYSIWIHKNQFGCSNTYRDIIAKFNGPLFINNRSSRNNSEGYQRARSVTGFKCLTPRSAKKLVDSEDKSIRRASWIQLRESLVCLNGHMPLLVLLRAIVRNIFS